MSCSVGCPCGLDLALVWQLLWCRPAAAAPIWPLAWDLPYAAEAAVKRKKKKSGIQTDAAIGVMYCFLLYHVVQRALGLPEAPPTKLAGEPLWWSTEQGWPGPLPKERGSYTAESGSHHPPTDRLDPSHGFPRESQRARMRARTRQRERQREQSLGMIFRETTPRCNSTRNMTIKVLRTALPGIFYRPVFCWFSLLYCCGPNFV